MGYVGGYVARGQTFYGPCELSAGMERVRKALLAWRSGHADGIAAVWPWIAASVILNERLELPAACKDARAALLRIVASADWLDEIDSRNQRSMAASL